MPTTERTDPDSWRPADPQTAAAWFSPLRAPWWIAGGWAIDLYLGQQTRLHGDLDVGILRRDLGIVRAQLADWEMFEAKDDVLTPLRAGDDPRANVHSLWCRPAGTAFWVMELMLDDEADGLWVYRRLPTVRRARSEVISRNAAGLPYLAPEVQLLYKAKWLRPKDQADFDAVVPRLSEQARAWLRSTLAVAEPSHSWNMLL